MDLKQFIRTISEVLNSKTINKYFDGVCTAMHKSSAMILAFRDFCVRSPFVRVDRYKYKSAPLKEYFLGANTKGNVARRKRAIVLFTIYMIITLKYRKL